jgi:hypothetical protein
MLASWPGASGDVERLRFHVRDSAALAVALVQRRYKSGVSGLYRPSPSSERGPFSESNRTPHRAAGTVSDRNRPSHQASWTHTVDTATRNLASHHG